jgi:hypothetical protein
VGVKIALAIAANAYFGVVSKAYFDAGVTSALRQKRMKPTSI